MKTKKDLFNTFFLIILAVLLLPGCETIDEHKKNNSLNDTMHLYRESLRWGEWAIVMSKYKPEPGQADSTQSSQRQDLDLVKEVRITNVDKTGVDFNQSQTRASTSIVIEYHLSNSNKIKSVNHPMTWWYDQDYKSWYTSTPLPDFMH